MASAQKLSIVFILSFISLSMVACGEKSDMPALGLVTGVVTLDGKPLADARITFKPEKGLTANGITDSEGKYELTYQHGEKGTIIGTNRVYIRTGTPEPDATAAEAVEQTDDQTPITFTAKKEILPAKYNMKTTLSADVKAGDNTIDFKLESK